MSETLPVNRDIRMESQALREKAVAAKAAVADLAVEAKDYAADRMRGLRARTRERLSDLRARTGSFIHENPYKALAIAAGAGLLLGLILKRR